MVWPRRITAIAFYCLAIDLLGSAPIVMFPHDLTADRALQQLRDRYPEDSTLTALESHVSKLGQSYNRTDRFNLHLLASGLCATIGFLIQRRRMATTASAA